MKYMTKKRLITLACSIIPISFFAAGKGIAKLVRDLTERELGTKVLKALDSLPFAGVLIGGAIAPYVRDKALKASGAPVFECYNGRLIAVNVGDKKYKVSENNIIQGTLLEDFLDAMKGVHGQKVVVDIDLPETEADATFVALPLGKEVAQEVLESGQGFRIPGHTSSDEELDKFVQGLDEEEAEAEEVEEVEAEEEAADA